MRLFIGIKLDELSVKKIKNYYKYFYSENITGNFTDVNNLHLTLAFLGEVNEEKIEKICDIINSLNLDFNQIKINHFTKLKDMLIGEVYKDDKLMMVRNELIEKLKNIGFKFEKLDFYPHITLIRKVMNLKPLKVIDSDIEIISNFKKITLFESTRINNKLVYIPKN